MHVHANIRVHVIVQIIEYLVILTVIIALIQYNCDRISPTLSIVTSFVFYIISERKFSNSQIYRPNYEVKPN